MTESIGSVPGVGPAAAPEPWYGMGQWPAGGEESMYSFDRMAQYALIGALAGTALMTVLRRRSKGPRALLDGALAALDAGAETVDGYAQAGYKTDLLVLFGPAIIAAGVVMAVQLGRRYAQAVPS